MEIFVTFYSKKIILLLNNILETFVFFPMPSIFIILRNKCGDFLYFSCENKLQKIQSHSNIYKLSSAPFRTAVRFLFYSFFISLFLLCFLQVSAHPQHERLTTILPCLLQSLTVFIVSISYLFIYLCCNCFFFLSKHCKTWLLFERIYYHIKPTLT